VKTFNLIFSFSSSKFNFSKESTIVYSFSSHRLIIGPPAPPPPSFWYYLFGYWFLPCWVQWEKKKQLSSTNCVDCFLTKSSLNFGHGTPWPFLEIYIYISRGFQVMVIWNDRKQRQLVISTNFSTLYTYIHVYMYPSGTLFRFLNEAHINIYPW
jgi:hypothetical protein